MITREEVFSIGRFTKPHGVKGEMTMTFTNDVFSKDAFSFLVCEMDGILVPFFVRSIRYKNNDTVLVQFEDVNDEKKAHQFDGVEVFMHRSLFKGKDMEEDDYSWNFFVGFTIEDVHKGKIGVVDEIDDSTSNILFVVKTQDGDEILIPATEEFITGFDEKTRILQTNLPDGLLE